MTALNRADTLQRIGKYPIPPGESDIMGLECVGEVMTAGVEYQKGSRVMSLLSAGGYAEYVAVDERLLMPIPAEMSDSEAACIPETWLTAYQLLHFVAGVKPGDKVLIHAGGSAVGIAAIQLTQAAGAEAYVTAGADSKIEFAKSLGAKAGFNYKTGEWATQIKEATGGSGVNIILDPVGKSYTEQNAAAIALEGRWIVYGFMSGPSVDGPLLASILRKRIRIEGTTLRARSNEYKGELVEQFWRHAAPRFADGTFKPVQDKLFGLDDIQAAHEYMETNASNGKILIRVAE